MADAGRPAKPTHLKVLHGDRKDRINTDEPIPGDGEVVPPWNLSKQARDVWDRLAPDRIAKGVLTPWDVDAFALFCEALVLAKQKMGGARRKPVPGAASPLGEWKTAVAIVSSLGSRFGWTPGDRAKLVVGKRDDGAAPKRLLS